MTTNIPVQFAPTKGIVASVPTATVSTESSVPTIEEQSQSPYVGLIIGVLLTIITLLIAGTLFVIVRIRNGKYTPTHSLVGSRIQDRITAGIHFQVYSSGEGSSKYIHFVYQMLRADLLNATIIPL